MPASPHPSAQLPRRLGLTTGIAVVVGIIIGSGIFRVPSPIGGAAGNLTGFTLVWVLGGMVALFGALSVAELAAMYPEAGGPYVHLRRKYETPYVAIGFIVVLAVIYVMLRDFIQLAEAYVLGIWPFLALCVIGLFLLRRTQPDFPRTYRALGYPMVPALFVIAAFVVVANALYAQFWSTIASILITLAGVPLYFLWMWWQGRSARVNA